LAGGGSDEESFCFEPVEVPDVENRIEYALKNATYVRQPRFLFTREYQQSVVKGN
jgi:hypothetical protein